MTERPAMSATSSSPASRTAAEGPATTQPDAKSRSRSTAKKASEVYASGVIVSANSTGRRVRV
jgi:hypothetical protein